MKKMWMETILYGVLSMLFGLAFFFSLLYEDNSLVTGRCYRIDPAYAQEEKIRYGFYFGGKKISDRRK